jgi:hypothetical protein
MMNSKERVKRALTFNKPDRVPIFNPPADDVFALLSMPSKSWQPNEKGVFPHIDGFTTRVSNYKWKRPEWAEERWWRFGHEEIDDWGCYWNKKALDSTMGHPGRPAIDTWDKLDQWEGPNITDRGIYELFGRGAKQRVKQYKAVILHGGQFIFTRASILRGFSNFLIDHLKNPQKVHQLISKITEVFLKNLEMWMEYKPDGVLVYDDLGTQQGLYFRPELFKKFYAAPYKKLINFAHNHDCGFHLHSCGNIGELIPTLIDIGVESLELDSPHQTGFDKLIEYQGIIPFWACVNIQSIYPNGTPGEIEQEVKHMIQTFSTPHGGFLAYFYPQPKAIQVPNENITAFYNALKKWGNYPLKIPS